jgi:D-alanine-D-alanine ligase
MQIAVLFGGTSSERDVSGVSGAQVIRALESRGHTVIAIDTEVGVLTPEQRVELLGRGIVTVPPQLETRSARSQILRWHQQLVSADVVFLALHGGFGENGTVQGLLELLGVPYTGSDVRGSAIAMDKDVSKQLFRSAGVPTADWHVLRSGDPITTELSFPVVVKPSREGSTVGLSVVAVEAELAPAVELALRYDSEVLVERFIEGRELTVGVLCGQALAVGEIIPLRSKIFDYESKYQAGGAKEVFPAAIPDAIANRAQAIALAAHRALKLGDYSRVDFRLAPDDSLWVLEVNTLPGMTTTSLLPQSAAAVGLGFEALCERLAEAALARFTSR